LREATFSGIARIKISLSDRELWIFRRKSNAFALPGQVLLPRQRKWMNTAFIPFGSSQNTQHTQAVSSIWNCSSGNAHLGSNCGLYSLTSRQILRREWHRRTPEISIGVLHPYFIDSVRPGRLPYHQASVRREERSQNSCGLRRLPFLTSPRRLNPSFRRLCFRSPMETFSRAYFTVSNEFEFRKIGNIRADLPRIGTRAVLRR